MKVIEEQRKLCTREFCFRVSFAFIIPMISILYPILNRYRGIVYVQKLPIDNIIPFLKVFILPYVSWYPYVAIFLIVLCLVDKDNYFKLVGGLCIGMLTCYLIYFFYPTYVQRPSVEDKDIFDKIVLWVYERDNPFNCWPSIHVLNAYLVALYTSISDKLSSFIKSISITISTLIILSTMFVKQHYLSDVIAGLLLGTIVYLAIEIFVKLKVNNRMENTLTD
ncbi:PAP2 superfamily protein [Clostridium homopropionicum DSM 5847]|uniref:PAP2 superfamily protein n=1 Tax=Clostridium homopropionicum DSM 5847 TaxID=1121318 RepID=A0A0L6Z768_9CLOT|nr:phosphatase PAP2 family protein [Clostridium homopropionicum]KOA18799.1 PAP2 superfamily protein [Clostridium homopropionicum DSM 5847]SFG76877.1 Membrane-associated phospholipid phosphatase [Clostridium homopropionicum]